MAMQSEPSANVSPLPELVTVKEVCGWTRKTARTVRNWIKEGHLRPVRIGRTVFFRRDEIELLLRKPQDDSPKNSKGEMQLCLQWETDMNQ